MTDLWPDAEVGEMVGDGTVLSFEAAGAITKGKAVYLSADMKVSQCSAADHNLLSATHPDTLAGSPVRGDILIGNATPKWSKLAIGLANRILKTDGLDPLWGLIVNENVDAAAAIAESKLALNYPTHNQIHGNEDHDPEMALAIHNHNLADLAEKSHGSLTGITADQHHAQLHKDSHKSGGSDAFTSTDLLEAVTKRLQESSGPTNLLISSVADGQYLKRSGTNIIGDTPAGGGGVSHAEVWAIEGV